MKPQTEYGQFDALDIRVGRILEVEEAASRKPTYRMTIDFGPEVGVKVSCGAFRNYAEEALVGRLVVAIVNFPVKKMGPALRGAGARRARRGRGDHPSHHRGAGRAGVAGLLRSHWKRGPTGA